MKTKTYYPITTALGAVTALSAVAHAATVQITLLGNKISSTTAGGDTLNADITGDGTDDLTFTNPTVALSYVMLSINSTVYNNVIALGRLHPELGQGYIANAKFGDTGFGDLGQESALLVNVRHMSAITFTDLRINGGAITEAWLEVNAFNTNPTSHTVALTRVIFDDTSTDLPAFDEIPGTQTEFSAVPEPSGLILLALGAGGLLTRRKR